MTMNQDDTPTEDLLAQGRLVLSRQPFSELLGAQLRELQPGRAELRLPIFNALLQQHGFVHGGVLAYLADNAIAFAGGSLIGGAVVSSGIEISFLRPARGRELVATASVIHPGRSLVLCRTDIMAVGEDGQVVLCAVAQGRVSRLRSRVDLEVD